MNTFGKMLLFAALASTPLLVMADDHDKRYYDREHKDYHAWNADENRAWSHYAQEQHYKTSDWAHAKREQQAAYWKWRHDHPGNDRDRH